MGLKNGPFSLFFFLPFFFFLADWAAGRWAGCWLASCCTLGLAAAGGPAMLLLGLPGCWAAGSVGLLFFLLLGLGLVVVWPAAGGLLMLHRSAGCCGLLFGSGQPGCYVMFFFLLFPFSYFLFFFFFFFSFFSSSFQTLAAAVFRPVMRRCRRSSLLSLSSFSPFLFFLFFLLSLLFSFLLSFSSISTTPKVEGVAAALALGSSSPRWPAIQR
ncbi:hypothetical protein ES288_D12G137200v1 [Gossypium darwinii]|nr:hypothetical protein ES288_D12G137200v1 [Gossypium darwinii]